MQNWCIRSSLMGECINPLSWPATTRELTVRLGSPETQISDAIRRGRVPSPPVRAGRRLWRPHDVRALALYLGRLSPDLAAELEHVTATGTMP